MILEDHCTECHTVKWLQRIDKTPSEWDNILAQMEAFGARLDEHEKARLVEYLTGAKSQ